MNRRFAPDLYLDVCEVRDEQGSIHIDGSGHVVEHCVKMRQYARGEELDRLLDGTDLYSRESTDCVYAHLARCAEDVLAGGYTMIVDATFSLRSQRALFAELAKRMSARLQVVFCDAPMSVLRKRITDRYEAGTDASEADLAVLDWQFQHREPMEPAESLDVVKVSATAPAPVDDSALRTLGR